MGNPNPVMAWKPGQSGNPGGKTKEHKAIETEAAIMAAKLRHAMLFSMQKKLDDGQDAFDLMSSDTLRLMKDSEDRAHGTPVQSTELSGPDKGPIPFNAINLAPLTSDPDDTPAA